MTEDALTTASYVLGKASLLDQTIAKPDPGILAAWAEQLEGITPHEGIRAVQAHYGDETRRIMPADVIKRVRAERATLQRPEQPDLNAVPDADPDDVNAWLEALRAGRLRNDSPKPVQPMTVLYEAAFGRNSKLYRGVTATAEEETA
jgi:hypothetical protein